MGEQPIELPIFFFQARTSQRAVGQTLGSTAVAPQQRVFQEDCGIGRVPRAASC